MDDLRWAMLGAGGLFLAGLAWWELRKQRHAAGDGDSDSPDRFGSRTPAAADLELPAVLRRVEPHFGDPPSPREIPDDVPTVHPREPEGAPPVVLVDDVRAVDDPRGIVVTSDVAVDTPAPIGRAMDLDVGDDDPRGDDERRDFPNDSPAAVAAVEPASAPSSALRPPPDPEWPPEDQRRIVSVRVVPRPPGRFAGRSLRQAFLACGLDYGAMEIFHLEDEQGRVVASAANLMRPGTFNLDTMDASHFHGVNLFCVLPGPLPPSRTVDELVGLARDLAQRLNGVVLDPVGQPLDEQAIERLRETAGHEQ